MHRLSSTYDLLLKLLRSSLYEEETQVCSLGSVLSERQWYKLLEEAEKQTVSGIVFAAISRLPEEEMPSVSVLSTWLAMAHRDASRYETMSGILTRLLPLLEANGLHPVLQKGHAAARFYRRPELRSCGDIDLWFPGQERTQADNVMRSRGMKIVSTPDNGSCYLVGHTDVEHHSMLIEIHNPFHSGQLNELCRSFAENKVRLTDSVTANVPPPMVEMLMMNAHILKHCLGVGIGLRQFCDYALAWRTLTDKAATPAAVDPDEYLALCRKLGILDWTRVLHNFINRYLPTASGPAVAEIPGSIRPGTVERIFGLICEGGNFGKYTHSRQSYVRRNRLMRKLHTMSSFLNNRSFMYRLAPSEAFWTFTRLLVGQIH